jgi:hypothetical protein
MQPKIIDVLVEDYFDIHGLVDNQNLNQLVSSAQALRDKYLGRDVYLCAIATSDDLYWQLRERRPETTVERTKRLEKNKKAAAARTKAKAKREAAAKIRDVKLMLKLQAKYAVKV